MHGMEADDTSHGGQSGAEETILRYWPARMFHGREVAEPRTCSAAPSHGIHVRTGAKKLQVGNMSEIDIKSQPWSLHAKAALVLLPRRTFPPMQ